MVGITIVYTGLVPQEISTLGITFGEADRQSLFVILAFVVLYFLAAFVVYGVSDFVWSRYAYSSARWPEQRAEASRRGKALKLAEMRAKVSRMLEEGRSQEEVLDQIRAEQAEALSKEDEEALRTVEQELRWLEEINAAIRESEERWRDSEERRRDSEVESIPILPDRPASGVYVPGTEEKLVDLDAAKDLSKYAVFAPVVSWVRALFEFLLPILVGLYTIYSLLTA